jgi:hypothetical protein
MYLHVMELLYCLTIATQQASLNSIFYRQENRDQSYDHYFRRFLTIFCEKIGAFLKNQCYDPFLQKPTVFCESKKFRRKYF